jgi:RNA recognition motif-containing protein
MNIFVAKLSRDVTSEDLIQLFGQYGEVLSAKVVADRMTRVSKGYGFVEMADEASGMEAINRLNETTFMERTIIVKQANPREDAQPVRKHMLVKKSSDADETPSATLLEESEELEELEELEEAEEPEED